jgi:hypothetical protein
MSPAIQYRSRNTSHSLGPTLSGLHEVNEIMFSFEIIHPLVYAQSRKFHTRFTFPD